MRRNKLGVVHPNSPKHYKACSRSSSTYHRRDGRVGTAMRRTEQQHLGLILIVQMIIKETQVENSVTNRIDRDGELNKLWISGDRTTAAFNGYPRVTWIHCMSMWMWWSRSFTSEAENERRTTSSGPSSSSYVAGRCRLGPRSPAPACTATSSVRPGSRARGPTRPRPPARSLRIARARRPARALPLAR